MTYGEHIQANRQHERDQYAHLSGTEQAERWQRRQVWLWSHFLSLDPRWVIAVPACHVCGHSKPRARSWPSFYECRCGIFFVLDCRSHLVPDDIERVSTMTPRMLAVFAEQHPNNFDPFGYSIEERIQDLTGV